MSQLYEKWMKYKVKGTKRRVFFNLPLYPNNRSEGWWAVKTIHPQSHCNPHYPKIATIGIKNTERRWEETCMFD